MRSDAKIEYRQIRTCTCCCDMMLDFDFMLDFEETQDSQERNAS
jgi:hypothetical protein